MSEHYQSHSWVDYARGLVAGSERASMSRHLVQCAACQRSARAFERLAATTLSPEPPEEVVERAQAIFAHPHPGMTREFRFERQPARARLLYDSAVARVAGGIRRSGQPASRRLLFEVGRYFLDVDLGREPGGAGGTRLVVVGQLVDRDEPDRSLPGLGVSLHDAADALLARGTSNALGEFALSCEAEQSALRLAVPVADDDRIEVDLPVPREGDAGPYRVF